MSSISAGSARCAFHPEEAIFNFCKSPSCFLPMCPICVKIHSEEHRAQKTHGDYESLGGVVAEIEYNIRALDKILAAASQDFLLHYQSKKRSEAEIRKKISEARMRLSQHIDRYMDDLEAALLKSLSAYHESTVEEFTKIDEEIVALQEKLEGTLASLFGERTLKTIITYYANDSLSQWREQVSKVESRIADIQSRSVTISTDSTAINEVLERLDRYILLCYDNYNETVLFARDPSKTKSIASSRCAHTKVS